MGNGVGDVRPLIPFRVKVLNLSAEPRTLRKNTILVFALPHLKQLLTLNEDDSNTEEQVKVASREDGKIDHSWQSDVSLDHLDGTVRDRVLKM